MRRRGRPAVGGWLRALALMRSGRGFPLHVSGPAPPPRAAARRVFAVLLVLGVTAVGVAQYSPHSLLLPGSWLAVGPLRAARVLPPRAPAALAGLATLLGAGLILHEPGGLANQASGPAMLASRL